VAYQLKRDFPALSIVINGGIVSLDAAIQHLPQVDGVMLGRAAIHDSYVVAQADRLLFGDEHPVPSRAEVALSYLPYIEQQLALGIRLPTLTRHLLSLFHGRPGARGWRRYLSENAPRSGAGSEVVRAAITLSDSYAA
jgi:tRNA-dihydrouridine synthase A